MINIINSKKSPPLIEYIIYINVKVLSSENIIEVIGKINKNKDGIIVITNTIIDMISKWDKTDVIIGL